ncbi:chromate transporter [Rubricella aquisinus]|uniref:Chromate transporter n=1 Tax=Rubricella aquisinus TaxID=2028108 RepID=A0A840WMW0_9RHOB|nr:chromate efflux transporter [Rubricella aquisinus]MBB5515433.1 chromate transporter [Rubricella aquisinus]
MTLASFTALWVKIGLLSFGGPAGQIALMQDEIVTRRQAISADAFRRGLDIAMILPGPEAQQLAVYLGWHMRGVWGGLIAGLAFIIPGAVLITLLAILAVTQGQAWWLEALFYGIQPVVLVIVARALWRLGGKAKGAGLTWAIALAAFAALLWGLSFPLVIGLAGLAGVILMRDGAATDRPAALNLGPSLGALGIGGALIGGGFVLAVLAGSIWADIAALFTTAAFVSFGGAYALLPFIAERAVEAEGWLTAGQMINGLALGETTPGPLILVTLYAGFFGGLSAGGIGTAVTAAAVTCFFTFAPSFTLMFAAAPQADRLGRIGWVRAALAGVSAAVIGVIANLAVFFGQAALFPAGWAEPDWPKIGLLILFAGLSAWRNPSVLVMIPAGGLCGLILAGIGVI